MPIQRTAVLALLVAFSLVPAPSRATIGTLDDVPAATLLLPYFEVDPVDPAGVTTVLTIRNASDGPVLAHVTVWSNLSVPVLDFDIYLTGYDSQSVNLRDVLVSGLVPVTAPDDAISPRGSRSKPHDDFGGTCGALPYDEPAITPLFREHLRNWLTGQPSTILVGQCAGAATDVIVGYVTIDTVNQCSFLFPSDTGYFEPGGTGVASDQNLLWGEWLIADPGNNLAQGDTLVAIEASADDPLTSTPGNRTFYGRYVFGSAADNREPLASSWWAALPTGETEALVWRDSGIVQQAFPCAALPVPFPLTTEASSLYDPDGLATPFATDTLPWETQRVTLGQAGSALDLHLDTSTGSPFDPLQQGHVTVLHRSTGGFSTGAGAVQGTAGALGAADAAPGASLLLPYFEVDLADPTGRLTAASIHNGSPDPVLAHAVLWTDLGVPTLGFDLLLPGHGSRTIDLGALFEGGTLPASGPTGADAFLGCTGLLPLPPLVPVALDGLRAAHTGAASSLFGGRCSGHDHGDTLARGYLTVDVVTSCSGSVPGDSGYFALLGFDNVLWGESVLVDPSTGAHADALVHLQASTSDPATAAGQPTFYGRYTTSTAADHREALPDRWGTEYSLGGVFDVAEHLVWRDPGVAREAFECGSEPTPFPMGQGVSLRFDEQGFDAALSSPAAGLATQRTAVPQPAVPGTFGWLFLDLDTWTGGPFGTRLQSHVTSLAGALGRFVTSRGAVQLPNVFGSSVSVVATDPEAAERSSTTPGSPDPGEITVGRTGPLDQPLDVLLSISGTATQGTDYELRWGPTNPPPASGSPLPVTIPAGASTLVITVYPFLDATPDDGETVVASVLPMFGYVVDPPAPATVTIFERPPGAIQEPVNVLEIPTLGLWGLGSLIVLLLGAGAILAKRG